MTTAYIGMGANLASWAGTPEATLVAAVAALRRLGSVVRRSSLYSTEPVGFAEQPRFVNAVVGLETELEPRGLLRGLLAIEREFGRDRSASFVNGPRTLDLDILMYGDVQITETDLQIPHSRLGERAFVLVPLCEIAPDTVDVRSGRTVSQLLESLRLGGESETNAVVEIKHDSWRVDSERFDGRPGLA
jgi:2-amino-4-hydroxy-6-hydroxymethyldihydropteridine diphosphokinase